MPYAEVNYFEAALDKYVTILLCSKFNPVQEGKNWAKAVYNDHKDIFVVYGLGLGYHIVGLLELLNPKQSIYVIDVNEHLVRELKEHICVDAITNTKVKICVSEKLSDVASVLNSLDGSNVKICTYSPCVKVIPKKNDAIKRILSSYEVRIQSDKHDLELLSQNKANNTKLNVSNINELFSKINKPIIIVSGGPSLDKNIDELKNVGNKAFVFSTGRSIVTLLNHKIKVDMCCIIDAKDNMQKQLEDVSRDDIPLVFLSTANHKAVANYPGKKYIAYSNEDDSAEGKIESGGSVATAMLDLSIRFGGNPIIFVGQDLAFTDNRSHCDNVLGTTIITEERNIKVKSADGQVLNTTKALLSYKYWIENKILRTPGRRFINASEGGAYIEGCIHQTLKQTINEL